MRWLRHLFARSARATYPAAALKRISAAVAEGELRHSGEVCFAVEAALELPALWARQDARARAHQVFAQLRVWDTAANNGVLIYLLLADHRIEIVADRGLAGLVSEAQWRAVCERMEDRLRAGDAEGGAIEGIRAVSDLLAEHFPRNPGDMDENELPDAPHLL
jgi:uncharacterized membrane protein